MGIKAKLAIWLLRHRKYLLPAMALLVVLVVYLVWFR